MAVINDEVFDQGLDYADTNGTRLDICSTDPGLTYATVTANSLGNTTVNTGTTANAGTGTGRRVTIPSVSGVAVTTNGTASHWALTNGTAVVIASGALSASQAVTTSDTWSLDSIDLIIRDPA